MSAFYVILTIQIMMFKMLFSSIKTMNKMHNFIEIAQQILVKKIAMKIANNDNRK